MVGDIIDSIEAAAGDILGVTETQGADGVIDLTQGPGSVNYRWTLNTSEDARKLAPKIRIRLLEVSTGQLIQLLSMAINMFEDPYKGLYKLNKVAELVLPFFSSQHHQNVHTWEALSIGKQADAVSQGVGEKLGGAALKAASDIVQAVRGATAAIAVPAYKTETPYAWRATGLETFSFNFNLYNTNESDYALHKSFIDKLVYWTLPTKLLATFALPPVLCEYHIPGIRRGLIAKLDFSVSTKGQVAHHDGYNIPDAYNLNFTISDLLMQTRNINPRDNGPDGLDTVILGSPSNATNVYT